MKEFNYTTHSIRILTHEFWVQGSNTAMLKEVAEKWDFKFDSLRPSKLSMHQRILRVWSIGELHDYLLKQDWYKEYIKTK